METVKPKSKIESFPNVWKKVPEEITETDYQYFMDVVSIDLTAEQKSKIVNPEKVFPRQETVLAVHWHPEFIPMNLIEQRIRKMFPNRQQELMIPTQHNVIMGLNGYSGVEVDCYSKGFNQKVQLLLHFDSRRLDDANIFREMLAHTFKYRSSQLYEFISTITRPLNDRLDDAAGETGANEDLVRFVQIYTRKIETLLEQNRSVVPLESIKNKILRNFFDCLRSEYGDMFIDRVQFFLKAVKKKVKENFSLEYFYRTSEIIEEARSLGAGIVIPHPEQFWPVLLADYDVDGYEVWNPQSQKYTEFLISVVKRKNSVLKSSRDRIIIFMGDDTHMGEKIRNPGEVDPEKYGREIGLQPAWDDLKIRKSLIMADYNRRNVIKEYKARLAG